VDRELIARRNRELLPNVAALVAEVRQMFPKARLIHGVDHETQYEVGRPGVDKLTLKDMEPRRCDEFA
jgi:hypothetical protein